MNWKMEFGYFLPEWVPSYCIVLYGTICILSTHWHSLDDFHEYIVFSSQAYEWVLRKAQELDWSEDSAKALVVIGDCEPHPPSYTDQQLYWHTDLDILCGMGIKVR